MEVWRDVSTPANRSQITQNLNTPSKARVYSNLVQGLISPIDRLTTNVEEQNSWESPNFQDSDEEDVERREHTTEIEQINKGNIEDEEYEILIDDEGEINDNDLLPAKGCPKESGQENRNEDIQIIESHETQAQDVSRKKSKCKMS